ncbi:endogenous retrovirus group K member 24 Gag polyprotein-like [Manis pentadactyla]|uniref:endogenous retrovirus group K member 24 Gag polyprotein-like n=1 Tax=Manis pentadactyla TaxID=143292 RepID=UPI00255C6571|nr:endogenous retrovirus group K member 24 Gag polyprotein-like [Manis pentadactyla]
MGQTETKATKPEDYLKLLRALLETSGVKTSKKDFAQLYKYIKKHCYWLPPQGTLKQADWDNVLRDFKKAHRQGNVIPVPVWSLCNLITLALQPLQTPPLSETKSDTQECERELLDDVEKSKDQRLIWLPRKRIKIRYEEELPMSTSSERAAPEDGHQQTSSLE